MKTIREYLEELPEPYRTQALGQQTNYGEAESMSDAILASHNWSRSSQGGNYWMDIYYQYKLLEQATEILTK